MAYHMQVEVGLEPRGRCTSIAERNTGTSPRQFCRTLKWVTSAYRAFAASTSCGAPATSTNIAPGNTRAPLDNDILSIFRRPTQSKADLLLLRTVIFEQSQQVRSFGGALQSHFEGGHTLTVYGIDVRPSFDQDFHYVSLVV